MKRTLSTLILALCATAAFATQPKPTPAPAGGGDAAAIAAAGALSLSASKSLSASSAQAVSGDSRASVGNVDVDAGSRGNTYVLPAPAATYVPQSSGTVLTNSHAVNLLVLSWSKSEQTTSPDHVAKEMIADMERLCQFETASMLRQRRYAKADPSYRELPAQPGVRNLTPAECLR